MTETLNDAINKVFDAIYKSGASGAVATFHEMSWETMVAVIRAWEEVRTPDLVACLKDAST